MIKNNTPQPNNLVRPERSRKIFPELRFPEFTDEWQEKKLGDISDLSSSKRVYLSDYVEYGVPFYRGKEISEIKKNKIAKDILYISQKSYDNFKNKFGVPKINDILITAVGTLGNVLRVKNNQPFYFKDGNLIWLKNIKENANFVELLLENKKKDISKTSIGSSQQALTIIGLNRLKLNIPSLPEQQKIAGFLTAVDEKIEKIEKKKELFTEYKKGIMQKIFSQQIRFRDENRKQYPDWEEKRLGEVCKILKGKQLNKSELKKIDKYACINGGIELSGFTNKWNTEANTITVSEGGNSCGFIGFINNRFWAGGHCYTIHNFKNTNNLFIYHFLKHNQNKIQRLRVGSGLPNIQKNDISKLKIKVPILEEQQKIADFLTLLDNKINQINSNLTQAKLFKKSLLQKMFV